MKTNIQYPISNIQYHKGIALILTISILSGLLALALGISTLLIREMKLSQEIANSGIAYGAADTGIERFMYGVNKESLDPTTCPCGTSNCYAPSPLSSGASYTVCTQQTGPPVQIKSAGTFRTTNRTIQISY